MDLVYVNDRVIAMGFPVDKRPPTPAVMGGGATAPAPPRPQGVRAGNDIDLVAALLRSRHAGHYMVWNVSEEGYDYSLFQDQVCRDFFFCVLCFVFWVHGGGIAAVEGGHGDRSRLFSMLGVVKAAVAVLVECNCFVVEVHLSRQMEAPRGR